jgi:hemerythrin-like domain-containing protein
MDVAELKRQHDEIAKVAAKLDQAVAIHSLPQAVGGLRWQLARLLMAHLALEDHILYPTMQRATDPETRATVARFSTEMGGLAERFSAYMRDWSDDRVVSQWNDFCGETRAILTALRARVDQENGVLYPLAARIESKAGRRKAG